MCSINQILTLHVACCGDMSLHVFLMMFTCLHILVTSAVQFTTLCVYNEEL